VIKFCYLKCLAGWGFVGGEVHPTVRREDRQAAAGVAWSCSSVMASHLTVTMRELTLQISDVEASFMMEEE